MNKFDFVDDGDKAVSREYNLAQVRRCPYLFDRHAGKLLRDWAELPGAGAPTLKMLRERDMLGSARFLGPERDQKTLRLLDEEFGMRGSDHEFFATELEGWLDRGSAKNVGVLNFDSHCIGTGEVFGFSLRKAMRFAKRQERLFKNFALIINVGLDRSASLDTFREMLAEHGVELCDEHLKIPGVLYGGSRTDRRSRRINYCVLFGPLRNTNQRE